MSDSLRKYSLLRAGREWEKQDERERKPRKGSQAKVPCWEKFQPQPDPRGSAGVYAIPHIPRDFKPGS